MLEAVQEVGTWKVQFRPSCVEGFSSRTHSYINTPSKMCMPTPPVSCIPRGPKQSLGIDNRPPGATDPPYPTETLTHTSLTTDNR